MPKVNGSPIKLGKAKNLLGYAQSFVDNPVIQTAIAATDTGTQTYFNNLDCSFVFDKNSLQSLIAQLDATQDGAIIMIPGANDDASEPESMNKPTMSLFLGRIDPQTNAYQIIYTDPADPDNTDGVEHPGLMDSIV